MVEEIRNKVLEDPEIQKLKNLSEEELADIFYRTSIEEVEDLMYELNGGINND